MCLIADFFTQFIYYSSFQLLSHETSIHSQVPFLLELGEYDRALDQAVLSGDPDLSRSRHSPFRDLYTYISVIMHLP